MAKYVSFDIFEYKIYYLFDLYLFYMEKVSFNKSKIKSNGH